MTHDSLTPKQLEVLQLIAQFGVLTVPQVAQLTSRKLSAARKTVHKLIRGNTVSAPPRPLGTGRGRPPEAYALTEAAIPVLRDHRLVPKDVPDERLLTVTGALSHQLLLNWCHLAFTRLLQRCSDLSGDFLSSTSPLLPCRQDGKPWVSDHVQVGRHHVGLIPDAVFRLSSEAQSKDLLFFLEVDMNTEPLRRTGPGSNIASKVAVYRSYFSTGAYHRYGKQWSKKLSGFRVLFVTNTPRRAEDICRSLQEIPNPDFIWVTDQRALLTGGFGDLIWCPGSQLDGARQSIIGPSLSADLAPESL